MKPARVLFRADASHAIGFGHIARALALIEEVRAQGGEPIVRFGGDPEAIRAWSRDRGLSVEVRDWSPSEIARMADHEHVHAVVIDGRRLADALVPELVARGMRSLVVDDNGHCELPVSAVINHNFHAPSLAGTYPNAHLRLLGRRYAMLRAEIRRLGHGCCQPAATRRLRVVVTFGGSDPVGATARITRLVPDDRKLELVIIAGPGYRHDDDLRDAIARAASLGHSVELHRSPPEPGVLFASAHAAICSAGGTLGELAYLGCPALAYAIVDDQLVTSRQQVREGVIAGGRTWTNLADDTIVADLQAFLSDDRGRAAQRERALATIDGDGPRRILDEAL